MRMLIYRFFILVCVLHCLRCDIPELHFNVIGIEKADEEPECTLNAMVQSYGIDDALLCHALTKIHGFFFAFLLSP